MIVAIESEVVKARGDTVPAGHVGRFRPLNRGFGRDDNVSITERAADQNNIDLNGRAGGKRAGTKKENSGRTDIAGYQCNGEFFLAAAYAAQLQGQAQSGARPFAAMSSTG